MIASLCCCGAIPHPHIYVGPESPARKVALCGHEHDGNCAYCHIERLRAALRKALDVWDEYRIDSTEDMRTIKAECSALAAEKWP